MISCNKQWNESSFYHPDCVKARRNISGGSNHRPLLWSRRDNHLLLAGRRRGCIKDGEGARGRKERKQVVDERLCASELGILTPPPFAPHCRDLLFCLCWQTQMIQHFAPSPSLLRLSPSCSSSSSLLASSCFAFPLSVSPAVPSLFFWKLSLAHYQESFVQINSTTPAV